MTTNICIDIYHQIREFVMMGAEIEIVSMAVGFGLFIMLASFAVMHGIARFCHRRKIDLNAFLQAE